MNSLEKKELNENARDEQSTDTNASPLQMSTNTKRKWWSIATLARHENWQYIKVCPLNAVFADSASLIFD